MLMRQGYAVQEITFWTPVRLVVLPWCSHTFSFCLFVCFVMCHAGKEQDKLL